MRGVNPGLNPGLGILICMGPAVHCLFSLLYLVTISSYAHFLYSVCFSFFIHNLILSLFLLFPLPLSIIPPSTSHSYHNLHYVNFESRRGHLLASGCFFLLFLWTIPLFSSILYLSFYTPLLVNTLLKI
jgi:hypothetical protein